MQYLGPDNTGERRDFGRLQHHGAAGCESGRNFAYDLVDRPIPRRDHADHTNAFMHNQGRALQTLELIGLQNFNR